MIDAQSKICPWLAASAWLLAGAWFFVATGFSWGDVTGGMALWSAPAAILAFQTVRWFRSLGHPLPARAVRWLATIWVGLVAFAFAVAGYGLLAGLAGHESQPVLAALDQPMRIIYATFPLLVTVAALAGIARVRRAPG